jgi:hypothetical protein
MGTVLTYIKSVNRHQDLTANEKVVAATLLLAYMWPKDFVRLRKQTLIERTGLSQRTVERATKGLTDKGIFVRVLTGRTTIFKLCSSVLSSKIVDSPPVANHNDTYGEPDMFLMTMEERHCKADDLTAAERNKAVEDG